MPFPWQMAAYARKESDSDYQAISPQLPTVKHDQMPTFLIIQGGSWGIPSKRLCFCKEGSISMARGSEEAYNEGQRVPDHCQQLNDEAKQRQDQAAQLRTDKKLISSAPLLVYIDSILEPALSPC